MASTSHITYRTLQGSNTRVSEVGLGCASAWGQPWFDEAEAIAIVRRALELGVTVFDTGSSYSHGNAEPRLGKALKGVGSDNLFLSTKVGTHIAPNGKLYHDLTREAVLRSLEASRRRLGLDVIPLLYLHGPRSNELNGPLLDTLAEVRDRGWVRWLGVNSFDTEVLESLSAIPVIDVVMLDYNVLRSYREPLITKLTEAGKFIVAGAAMANHLYAPSFLWPKSMADVWYSLRAVKNYRQELFQARKFASLGTWGQWTRAQIALAFVLSNKQVGSAMFSTTRLAHLEDNVAACGLKMPDDLIRQIRSE
jgi:aryl-alcohol dehydrogenase-like predicted oxidoreductase